MFNLMKSPCLLVESRASPPGRRITSLGHDTASALFVFRGFFGRRFGGRGFFTRKPGDFFFRRLGGLRFSGQRIRFYRAFCRRFLAESRFGGGFSGALRLRGGYGL